jgi:hypothetical protein
MNQGQTPGPDLYAVLGLTPEASAPEIRAAYQRLSADVASGQAPPIQRQAIEVAYETLGDPIRRLRYDAQASAPTPSRIQLPALRVPGVRLPVHQIRVPGFRRPGMPRVDPVLAAAIALVALVGLAVILLPLLRGRDNGQPAQSVADLVASPTPGAAASPTGPGPGAAARSPFLGAGPNAFGPPGGTSSLLPPTSGNLPAGAPPGGLLPAQGQPPPGFVTGEPPFLTGSAIIDMLRAVAAASAVRNGPPPASLNGPAPIVSLPGNGSLLQPGAPPNTSPPQLNAPAGVPITSLGSLPPAGGGSQPAASQPGSGVAPFSASVPQSTPAAPATPAPTATRAPNRITVPGAGPSSPNLAALGATRVPAASSPAPNHFVPAPTPVH